MIASENIDASVPKIAGNLARTAAEVTNPAAADLIRKAIEQFAIKGLAGQLVIDFVGVFAVNRVVAFADVSAKFSSSFRIIHAGHRLSLRNDHQPGLRPAAQTRRLG